jgi:TatD DNase family protein
MAYFFDTHAHLDFPDYANDLAETVKRAQDAGIAKIISVGTDLESSRHAIKISEKFPDVYAAVGWHPSNVMDAPNDLRPVLFELAKHSKVVAIGEIGLDYHHLPSSEKGSAEDDIRYKQRQLEIFQQQLEVAVKAGLNCIIHQRNSFEDTLAQLKSFAGKVRGVFHCFSETPERMRRVLELGSFVSFTGIATFKNGQNVRDTLAVTPLDKFMLESDCPYLAPVPYRGKRCEPAYVKEISEVVVQVKGCPLEELSAATCKTAKEFFPNLGAG